MDKIIVGQRLKAARALRGMNDADLAARVGKTAQAIGQMRNGRSGMEMATLHMIGEALDVSCDFLLGQSDTFVPNSEPAPRAPEAEGAPWMRVAQELAEALRTEVANRELELRLHAEIELKRIEQVEAPAARAREAEQLRLREESAGVRENMHRLMDLMDGPLEGDLPHRARSPVAPEQAVHR